MPKVKVDHIISFSSEDPVHIANNILSNDTLKKWKCQTPGEKNAVVVLQLEKASVITGIDIGNEHSAYVEILVSRSGTSDDYKVLLVTSSFMTPLEARQSQNINKVRMFTKEHFSKPEADEKWDRVKVVCTQPFNKYVQYGLSFININTIDEKATVPTQTHIGKFILRPESPDNLSIGSLFEKRKQQKQEEKLTGAAAIRDASSMASLALYGSPVCKPKLKTEISTPTSNSKRTSLISNSEEVSKPRNRNELLYNKDEEEPNDKIDKLMKQKQEEVEKEEFKLQKEKPQKPQQKTKQDESNEPVKKNKTEKVDNQVLKPLDISINTPSSSKKKTQKLDESSRKRKTNDETRKRKETKKAKKATNSKPFVKLLEGVTLVISGIQNPDRGNLRAQALSMGAKYKPDWDNSCTHLICAFPNTPKFNQVKGKGKIVKQKWIEDCHSQRKRLPWRRYALDKNDIGKPESEDEILEKIDSPPPSYKNDDVSDFDAEQLDQASDTEEKVARIQESLQVQEKENGKQDNDVYNADTDDEDITMKVDRVEESDSTSTIENFIKDRKFYVDQAFDSDAYKKFIIYYNGETSDDPSGDIDYMITKKEHSEFLKEVNTNALCIDVEWIQRCLNSHGIISVDEFIL